MPARGRILIKRPETEDTLPGGTIIIPEKAREAYSANQFLVVSVGEPEACDWPQDCDQEIHTFITLKLCVHPIDERVVPGAWVICRPRSLVDVGDGIYAVRQGDIFAVFSQQSATELPEVA